MKSSLFAGVFGWLATAGAAFALTSLEINGTMDEADGEQVKGWKNLHHEKESVGKLIAVQDTDVFNSASASLKLMSEGGVANGNVNYELPDTLVGKKVRLSGYVRRETTEKLASAQVVLFAQDAEWKKVMWEDAATWKAFQPSIWTPFERTISVPENAKYIKLMLFMNGEGSVWLDDVAIDIEE